MRQTLDGGYIVVGSVAADDWLHSDVWLLKTDAEGDTVWTRQYEGGGRDVGKCVQQTTDGGYIITGYRNGPTEPPAWSGGDLWLIKTDDEGIIVWDRTYGGSYYSVGNWVEQTSDGGYIVTGDYIGAYLWLLKADKDGYLEWQDTIDAGGTEIGHCVQQTSEGGYIVTGFWTRNLLLLKTDTDGDSVWMRLYGIEDYASRGRCVKQTNDGGYVMVGYTGPSGWRDLWLLRTDAGGDSLWANTYGGGDDDGASEVQQTTDGDYVIVGTTCSFGTYSKVWLLKTDSLGDTLWTRIIGGNKGDGASSVQQTSDGGYIITGITGSFGDDNGDLLLIKTDSLGYVGIEEPSPVTRTGWEVVTSVGRIITLRYTDRPEGFRASIYDATGRKVDEIQSINQSGTVTWPVTPGEGMPPGVYFVREESEHHSTTRKVILIR